MGAAGAFVGFPCELDLTTFVKLQQDSDIIGLKVMNRYDLSSCEFTRGWGLESVHLDREGLEVDHTFSVWYPNGFIGKEGAFS